MFNFPRGQELPALYPVMETKDKKQSSEDEEEERSLTDAQQLKQDTVKVWKRDLIITILKIFFLVNSALHVQLLQRNT